MTRPNSITQSAPIEAIEARLLPSQLKHGLQLRHMQITGERPLPVVRCVNDDASGFGEAPPLPSFTGEDGNDTLEGVQAVAPQLLGLAPEIALDRLHRPGLSPSSPVRAALDIALHDLLARAHGVPLHNLLGQVVTPQVRISRAIGFHEPETTVALAQSYRESGVVALKLKVGRDVYLDAAIVQAVRQAVGPEVELAIDANESMSTAAAIALVEACRDINLAYFEQPVFRDDHNGLRAVRQADVKVLVDESLFTVEDAQRLLEQEAADLFAIKLIKCGGLRPALEIVNYARDHGVPVIVIDPLGSAVSLNSGLHLASIIDDSGYAHGLSAGLDVNAAHAPHLPLENGRLCVPSGPGLGVDVRWSTQGVGSA